MLSKVFSPLRAECVSVSICNCPIEMSSGADPAAMRHHVNHIQAKGIGRINGFFLIRQRQQIKLE